MAAEARFCRLCGAPLKTAGVTGQPVNPRAKTAPLSEEGRTTHGFPAEDGNASSPNTTRVRRAEMEDLLRHAPASPQTEAADAAEGYAAPETAAISIRPGAALEDSLRTTAQDSSESVEKAEAASHAEEKKSPQVKVASGKVRAKGVAASEAKSAGGSRRVWQLAALALLFVAVGAALLAFYYSRGKGDGRTGDAPISISDQQRRVEENLKEADRLLGEGKVPEAIARLRYAIKLDPSNARAHRMLADALERSGNVNEAIDEYRAAIDNDPRDEETRLRYADALRRVGRVDQAREIYQQLSASSTEEVARTAKEKLAQLPAPPAAPADSEQGRDARAQNREGPGEASANQNGPSSNDSTPRAEAAGKAEGGKAANDPAASYNRAMKIIEGKDIKKMNRADLILAYTLFQYAQRGPNKADAERHLRELDNELFVRRKRKQ